METKKVNELKHKIADYQRFGLILLSLSAFLYLGLILPKNTDATLQSIILGSASLITLFLTTIMYLIANKCKKQLNKAMS